MFRPANNILSSWKIIDLTRLYSESKILPIKIIQSLNFQKCECRREGTRPGFVRSRLNIGRLGLSYV